MDIFDIITLAGGLALFLFGMTFMGEGLKRVAGSKLEIILEKLTSNPLKGVLLGTVVTAVIQSSSATTVMVVGFVNSGIMKLSQAIGIVMGANIGTTATGWILTLSGADDGGGSFVANLLKSTTFTPVVALIGIALYMFAKKQSRRHVGTVLLGFAILMYGMNTMSTAVAGLKSSSLFTGMIETFKNNPILGILIGIIITAIIQSSSASVGILQALSATGIITNGTALPLILGMNIGACVPVLLSAIGANKNGKRTALVYLYFNIIGTAVFMGVYYIIGIFYDFSFSPLVADKISIALINTIYKVFSTVVLLPFVHQMEKLVCLSIRDRKGKMGDEHELLDERFLEYPPLAIERCRDTVNFMADEARLNLLHSIDQIEHYDHHGCDAITDIEEIIDGYEDKLGTYLVKLSSKELSANESKEVSKLLHSIGNFERIGDHAINIMETAQEINEKKIVFSPDAARELDIMTAAVSEVLNTAINAFKENDIELARKVEPLEQVVDMLRNELKFRHIQRLQSGTCTLETGFVFNDIIANYERIADHCSNIAVCIIQLKEDKIEAHGYLRDIKDGSETDFTNSFEHYKEIYLAPLSK